MRRPRFGLGCAELLLPSSRGPTVQGTRPDRAARRRARPAARGGVLKTAKKVSPKDSLFFFKNLAPKIAFFLKNLAPKIAPFFC